MLFDETAVRDNIRNRNGKRVFYLARGDQLTSGARDWLLRERIGILPAEQAKPAAFRLPDGGYTGEKPEHMTHLDAENLVPKDHPRIRFRGKLDSLQAELMMCQLKIPRRASDLGQILALSRRIIRCDVLGEALEPEPLCGLTEAEQRRRSHFPQNFYGQPHFMPEYSDGETICLLNRLRCLAREAELAAVEAFLDGDKKPTRPDILRAMNRMSSMLYLLMIEEKAKL